ncbi:alpha-keto acid decarboxylase family protein [Erwinia piriflorinigrans]|uniref:Putative decarboxylase n=1 Tax=Erwinia piriflorinigrans CFBP 5888 TaxID=1161919 RepID=V5Z959_9GAMM|nr:thiamine pyrophosphate-binding protein [Erwinia piriflorinigrans]CCG87917.1 putative decarboxylase [Erwinia piriflorinigrans CFBP 5888]
MKKYTVGDYLLTRLNEIGIGHLFGVPGDYNLQFLDHVIDNPDLVWVGCANELNAAYAADGYARCRGAAALLTTFGVGELSAINGVAGSSAEYLPVVHIVGAPSQTSQNNAELLHHTLGDGDFGHFIRMQQEISVASSILTPTNAAAEIDRVLVEALTRRRPVYLLLATNVAESPLSPPSSPLQRRLDCDNERLAAFVDAAQSLLAAANSAALLADFLADRAQQQQILQRWLTEVPMPFATLLMGKSVLPEMLYGFAGTYAGASSADSTREVIENSDVLISVGVKYTDTITAGFTQRIARSKNIDVGLHASSVGGRNFEQIPMAAALKALHQLALKYGQGWQRGIVAPPVSEVQPSDSLTQNTFWHAIQDFLRPGDIVLADQGTAAFGVATLRLPQDVRLLIQPLWGSIGYTLPAAFGAQTARPQQRVVLIIGDGSAQLTVQELGSMLRDGQNPVIFLLNNDGYTVERAIHGAQQRYNDIAHWDWTRLPQTLDIDSHAQSWRVTHTAQLREIMQRLEQSELLSLVEVVLSRLDVPPLLASVSRALNQRNSS